MNPCCCGLKTGATIIALLQITVGVIGFIITGIALSLIAWVNNTDINFSTGDGRQGVEFKFGREHSSQEKERDVDMKLNDEDVWLAYTVFAILFVMCAVDIISGVILLIGIKKESIGMMKVWVAFKCVALFVAVVMNIVSLATRTGYKPGFYDGIQFLWSIYFMWVVIALIQETKQNESRVQPVIHKA